MSDGFDSPSRIQGTNFQKAKDTVLMNFKDTKYNSRISGIQN